MEAQETQFRQLYEQFLAWKTSQQQQTDGYAYEESFAAFVKQMNQQLLAIALQEDTTDQPVKKK
jgi:hypothetical protein